MESSVDRQVAEALDEFSEWGTIDELYEFVTDRITVPAEFQEQATRKALIPIIRRKIKARRTDDGLAEFESVERETEDGKTEKVYKQLTMFDKEDFKLSANFYGEHGTYCCQKANSLIKRCNAQLGTRLQLPFPSFGLLEPEASPEPVK